MLAFSVEFSHSLGQKRPLRSSGNSARRLVIVTPPARMANSRANAASDSGHANPNRQPASTQPASHHRPQCRYGSSCSSPRE